MHTNMRVARGLLDLLALGAVILLLWQASPAMEEAWRPAAQVAGAALIGLVVFLWTRVERGAR